MTAKKQITKHKTTRTRRALKLATPAPNTPTANLLRELRIANDLAGSKGLVDLSNRLCMYISNAITGLEAAEKATAADTSPGGQGWIVGRWYPATLTEPRRWHPCGVWLHETKEGANGEAWQQMLARHTTRTAAKEDLQNIECKFIKVY